MSRRAALLSRVTPADRLNEYDHLVQFYEDDTSLSQAVCEFLAPGFALGEPLLVVTTPTHRETFLAYLVARGIDVEKAKATGQLTVLDAQETLAKFMEGSVADWTRFKATIGELLEQCLAGATRKRVRIYGEMVDILWQQGQRKAAIALETFWNELGRRYPFSLLCAYVVGGFYKERDLHDICRAHGDVLTDHLDPSALERFPAETLSREAANALLAEIQHGKVTERLLQETIAELRAREQELILAQRELRDFVDNASIGLHWVGPDGIIQWANRAELDFLGYSEAEYIGHPIARFHVDQPVIEDILERLARNETLHNYEARLRAKDGTIKHVLISSNVYWRDGEFVHTRCFTRDIAERREMEEHLRKKEMEATEAKQRAEVASRAKDQFLAILGHELRNPLTPILTALELMDQRLGDTAKREREAIERQVNLLVRLVDDLLDISRVTRGRVELKRHAVELSQIMGNAIEMAGPAIEKGHHRLETHLPSSPLWINGDEDRLAQVFANLLINAARYTPSHGRIHVRAALDGHEVVVRVRDSGMGIGGELLPHLFDVFVQGKDSTSQGGLGLGLAIVRNLVALHDGSVSARSDGPGQGSEFEVRLPAVDAQVALANAQPSPTAATTRPHQGCRMLIVDDNPDSSELLSDGMSMAGYDVRAASDGLRALKIASDFQPEVALLDIGMPVMDGYEVARRLRDLPGLEHIKLIAITGYSQQTDRTRIREAGFHAHLIKPLRFERIESTLEKVFGASEPSP